MPWFVWVRSPALSSTTVRPWTGLLDDRAEPTLLGVEAEDGAAGAAHFVVDLSHVEAGSLLARSPGGEMMDLRELVQIVPGGPIPR